MDIITVRTEPIDPGSDESESLIDVNKDTHGEEYYGGSSSVAICYVDGRNCVRGKKMDSGYGGGCL
jgi:hypothetical protein